MDTRLTPAQAWEGYVGPQSPQEFVQIAVERDGIDDIDEICRRYASDLPNMFEGFASRLTTDEIAGLLAEYIRQSMENEKGR